MSSPVFTTAVTDEEGTTSASPTRNRAAPTPPQRAVITKRDPTASLPWAALAVAAVPALVLIIRYLIGLRDESFAAGDYAVLEAGTRSALRFEQFLGPYSRYHWHQPGPLPFYWLAPFYAAAGQNLAGLGLGAVVLNLLCLSGIVVSVDRLAGRRAAWAATVAIAAFTWSYGIEQFGEVWNPSMTVLPVALIVVLAAALVAGAGWALPWLALASSFAVQTHLSTGPTVLVLVAIGVGAVIWRHRRSLHDLRSPVVATAVVVYVSWVLPVFQQVSREPGNLGQLLTFFRDNTHAPHSIQAAAGAVVRVLGTAEHNAGIFVRSTTIDVRTDVSGPVVLVVAMVSALALLGSAAWRRKRSFPAALAALGLASIATCVLAARQVTGPLLLYVLVFICGVGLAALVGVLVGVTDLVGARVDRRAVLAVGVVALGVLTVLDMRHALDARLVSTRERAPVVADLLPAVLHAVERTDGPVRIEIFTHEMWSLAGAVLNELEQRGAEVTVQSEWTFLFGNEREASGNEPAVLVFASPGQAPAGECVVAEHSAAYIVLASGDACRAV